MTIDPDVNVKCALANCDVSDPDRLQLYLKDESRRPLTKSGGKKWGTNLYPAIVAGHVDPGLFMVLCKEHRTMYTSSRAWRPLAPEGEYRNVRQEGEQRTVTVGDALRKILAKRMNDGSTEVRRLEDM